MSGFLTPTIDLLVCFTCVTNVLGTITDQI